MVFCYNPLQSAQALMLGMYPRDNSSTTQTVELFTMETANDYMTVNPKCVDYLHDYTFCLHETGSGSSSPSLPCSICPRSANYSTAFKRSTTWTSHYNNVTAPLLAQVNTATGFDIDVDDLDHFCDCLNTHYCHGLEWPSGISDTLFRSLWSELSWQAYNMFKFPSVEENAQTGIGHLLRELWQVRCV